jgi:hypothetical protein
LTRRAQVYSVSRDGALFVWKWEAKPDTDGRMPNGCWRLQEKHYFMQAPAKVTEKRRYK